MEPYSAGLQFPFAVKRGAQKPWAQTLAPSDREESEILQLDIRDTALEFAQPECLTAVVPEEINRAALRLEEAKQLAAQLKAAASSGNRDAATRAHLIESASTLDEALKAPMVRQAA